MRCSIAIVSPEVYGLHQGKVPVSARRALVLCGKIITALCNDVEFGSKENILTPMNEYLKENRSKILEFIQNSIVSGSQVGV